MIILKEYCELNSFHKKISQYIINKPLCLENDKLNGGDGNAALDSETDYNQEVWMD